MHKIVITLIAISVFTMAVHFDMPLTTLATAAETEEKGAVINDFCPVMGGKIDKDTPYRVEYNGKTIGLCCAGCVPAFKADPEKYMKKLQKKRTIECPECGTEIEVPVD